MIIFSLVLYASRIIFLSISRASRAFLPILWPGRFVVPCCRLLNIFCKFRVKFMALILKCKGPDTLLVLIFLNIGRWDWPILSFGVLYSENIEIISTSFNCKQTSVVILRIKSFCNKYFFVNTKCIQYCAWYLKIGQNGNLLFSDGSGLEYFRFGLSSITKRWTYLSPFHVWKNNVQICSMNDKVILVKTF